jgi:hypothetical protein
MQEALVKLFQEVGPAHHQAYQETDGYDPEWPIWYAIYLQPELCRIAGMPITQSKIIQLLVTVYERQAIEAPLADWREYYPDFFLKEIASQVF